MSEALYGRRQDLQEIQRRSADIIKTGRLTYDDIETITHAESWRGGTFWQWPTSEEFNERCANRPLDGLSILPRRRAAIIDQLLYVFRHIEPVSVVLRFVDPGNFGILSPPVEKLLEIGPSHKPREKYLRYIRDLQDLRDRRGFKTAAEVDMALWVVREAIETVQSRTDRLRDTVPEHRSWAESFWSDRMLREIRVRNLTESLFGTMTPAELAEALLSGRRRRGDQERITLAARIAGIEFEQAVMQVDRVLSTGPSANGDSPALMDVVHTLAVQYETRKRWKRAVRTRNAAVHGDRLNRDEVEELLGAMRDALDWAYGLTERRN
ncbi:MAG: hypothetical protein OXC14_14135 [Rhodospirillaceae bacterium]|nr:hypothetical protein [Rhodospirillaceae bacterium]